MNIIKKLVVQIAPLRSSRIVCGALAALTFVALHPNALAGPVERAQAKRMFDRLTGTPPSPALLTQLEAMIGTDGATATAEYIIDPDHEHSRYFYSVTLKNFAAPWTNRDQTVFEPLNDYTATVIGFVRDGRDFRGLLYEDVLYHAPTVPPAYSATNNTHYETLEANNADLRHVLQGSPQGGLNGLPYEATAGIITSRAAAQAFFILGTNRAMFRFTLLNHLCRDLEQVHDVTRPPDRIRQDISRSPGGDSSVYNNNCIGCHNGMDPLAQAFAYYDFDIDAGRIIYTPGQVRPKYLINAESFKPGYITTDDQWENRWRLPGQNTVLGWEGQDGTVRSGYGAKSLGRELAHSEAFAQCQVEKVFRAVCFRSPSDVADHNAVNSILGRFRANNFNLRRVFADTAAYCSWQ